jgi:Mg2+-importing ATPase
MEAFKTGEPFWSMQASEVSALIALVVRTRHLFYRSRPGLCLGIATAGVILATLFLPYSPLARLFEFTHLPPAFMAALVVILFLYVTGAEIAKRLFYGRGHA